MSRKRKASSDSQESSPRKSKAQSPTKLSSKPSTDHSPPKKRSAMPSKSSSLESVSAKMDPPLNKAPKIKKTGVTLELTVLKSPPRPTVLKSPPRPSSKTSSKVSPLKPKPSKTSSQERLSDKKDPLQSQKRSISRKVVKSVDASSVKTRSSASSTPKKTQSVKRPKDSSPDGVSKKQGPLASTSTANFNHLSEEEKVIVVGFTPSPKKAKSTPSTTISQSLPPSSSTSDCSLLMEVKKGDKMVFVNPFASSPVKAIHNSSDSVIVIENSPVPQNVFLCTSTPRPSLEAPALSIFASPIDKSSTPIHSQTSFFFSSPNDATVVNKDDTDHTNREEEDMDWDESVAITTLNDVRENTVLLESETVGDLTEMVAQKSFMISSQPDAPGNTVLVIDTNVFISALRCVIDVLKHPLAVSGQLFVLLPWVVLQELDYLKQHHKNIRFQCMSAVRFINEQLMSDNTQLISQSPQQAAEKLIQVESNDDKIIICCLQRQKTHTKDRVILITRDINLSSKAMVAGIESSNNQTMWKKLLPGSKNTEKEGDAIAIQATGWPTVEAAPQLKQQHREIAPQTRQHLRELAPQTRQHHRGLAPQTRQHHRGLVPQPRQLLRELASQPRQHHMGPAPHPRHEPCQSTDHQNTRVVHKLSYVFDCLEHVRFDVCNANPPPEIALSSLKDVLPRADVIRRQYERCLMLSPIVLNDYHEYFSGLRHSLNNFSKCLVPIPDKTECVSNQDLIHYFQNSQNRPRLGTGLETLKELLHSFVRVGQRYFE